MLGWFKQTDIVDEDWANHTVDLFQWALEHFDQQAFKEAALVLPNQTHFPDKFDNEWDMAQAILKRVKGYAGLSEWPFVLVKPSEFNSEPPPKLTLNTQVRNNLPALSLSSETNLSTSSASLPITYHPAMVKQPMDMVANICNLMSQHFLIQAGHEMPGGVEVFNQNAELISAFFGFGLILSNSAYTFRGSCARCVDPNASRYAAMDEAQAIFALAVFCQLKGIEFGDFKTSLKPHLRPVYKRALTQVRRLSNPARRVLTTNV